jgi:hypothetical protein
MCAKKNYLPFQLPQRSASLSSSYYLSFDSTKPSKPPSSTTTRYTVPKRKDSTGNASTPPPADLVKLSEKYIEVSKPRSVSLSAITKAVKIKNVDNASFIMPDFILLKEDGDGESTENAADTPGTQGKPLPDTPPPDSKTSSENLSGLEKSMATDTEPAGIQEKFLPDTTTSSEESDASSKPSSNPSSASQSRQSPKSKLGFSKKDPNRVSSISCINTKLKFLL